VAGTDVRKFRKAPAKRFDAGKDTVPRVQPDAVPAFAERFASGALDADRAMLDILLRNPPRLKGRTGGVPIQQKGESLPDAVIRAVHELDNSYLFVQGPPGTGKTFTAAQAIVSLLRAGKRVGLTSNSHKAINKLLSEIEKRI
jgi:Mrp family chromosome partitioning ATPase